MRRLLLLLLLASSLFAQDFPFVVLLRHSGEIGIFEAGGALAGKVQTGPAPQEMVLSSDHKNLYVTRGDSDGAVVIISLEARKRIASIPLGPFRHPSGIAWDTHAQHLLVVTQTPGQVLVVDLEKRSVLSHFDPHCSNPNLIVGGKEPNTAYISCSGSSQVVELNTNSGATKLMTVGIRPQGLVLSKEGEVFVANEGSSNFSVLSTTTHQGIANVNTGKGPVRVMLTPDGKTLVYALHTEKKVAFANPYSRTQQDYALLPGEPSSISVSPDGRYALTTVEKLDSVYIVGVREKKIVKAIQLPDGSGPGAVLPL